MKPLTAEEHAKYLQWKHQKKVLQFSFYKAKES